MSRKEPPEPMGFDEALEAILAGLAESEPERSDEMSDRQFAALVAEHGRALATWTRIAGLGTRREQRAAIEAYIQDLSRQRGPGWSEMLTVCRRLLGVLRAEVDS